MVHGSRPYDISTHTPLTGRDDYIASFLHKYHISTHTPLTGRDDFVLVLFFRCLKFLLTRPLRDVTGTQTAQATTYVISTHTPLTGRDNLSYPL